MQLFPSITKSISKAYDLLSSLSVPNSPTHSTRSSISPSPPRKIDVGYNAASFPFVEEQLNISNSSKDNQRRNPSNDEERELYQDGPNGIVETLDVESDTEVQNENTILLTNLNVDVTEVEIQKTISSQNLSIKRPSKITIRRFAGKCDASLFFDNDKNASEFRSKISNRFLRSSLNTDNSQAPRSTYGDKKLIDNYNSYSETCFSAPSSPMGGVSPPRLSESENNIQIVEENQHMKIVDNPAQYVRKKSMLCRIIPIFVDIFTENGKTISRIKVNLVTHQKCQQFYGQEPTILVSAFLNYMKKYYQDKRNLEMLFIVPCVATFNLFFSALLENPVNKEVFDFYFTYWADLQSLVKNSQYPPGHLKSLTAAVYNPARVAQLWQHVKYPEIVTSTDSVQTMKYILDEVMTRNLPGPSHSYMEQILHFSSPCNIPHKQYMTVVLHVGVLEVDIQHQGRVLPVLGTLGFRNSQKGSWFVPIEPSRTEGNIVVESATKLGFVQYGSSWVWSQDNTATCLVEQEALECFISVLKEEKEISDSEGVILITPRRDESMAILMSALVKHNLLDSFLNVVDGLADIEELACTRNIIFESPGLAAYEAYYLYIFDQCIDLSKPETVPKMMYQILESLLYSVPSYDNFFSHYSYPVISPYTNNILHQSQLLDLREDYHCVTVLTRISIKPASLELVSLLLRTANKTDIGREFFVLGFGNIKFGWNKAKLAPNLHLVLTVQNTGKQMLVLEPGDCVGLAHKQDNFPYPTSQYLHPLEEHAVVTATAYKPPQISYSRLDQPIRKSSTVVKQYEPPKISLYDDQAFQKRISDTLPFGDMIKKYRNQLPNREGTSSFEQNVSIKHKEQQLKTNLDKRSPFRDPRLNKKLAKAKQRIDNSSMKKFSEKSDCFQITSELEAKTIAPTRTSIEDPKWKERDPPPPPLINLDLSKESICKKTLELVDKEVKAIAVTIDLDVGEKQIDNEIKVAESSGKIPINESSAESLKQILSTIKSNKMKTTNFSKSRREPKVTVSTKVSVKSKLKESPMKSFPQNIKESLDTNTVKKELCKDVGSTKPSMKGERNILGKESTDHHNKVKTKSPHSNTSAEKKIVPEPFFDFLKESTPTKKSGKYISKREELIRNHHKHYKVGKKQKMDDSLKPEKEKPKHVETNQSLLENVELTKGFNRIKSKDEKKLTKDDEILLKHSTDKEIGRVKESENFLNQEKEKPKHVEKNQSLLAKVELTKGINKIKSKDEKKLTKDDGIPLKHFTDKEISRVKESEQNKKNESNKQSPEKNIRGASQIESKDQKEKSLVSPGKETVQINEIKPIDEMKAYSEKSKKEEHTCNLCGEIFNVVGTFRKHSKTKHSFKCDFCDLVFNRATKLDDHMNTAHDFVGHIEPTQCGLCGDVFRRSSLLARHISSPHIFACGDCEMKFQNEKSLNKHHCNKQEETKSDQQASPSTIKNTDKSEENVVDQKLQSNILDIEPLQNTKRCRGETLGSMAIIHNAADVIIIECNKIMVVENNIVNNAPVFVPSIDSPVKKKEDDAKIIKAVQPDTDEDKHINSKKELCLEEYKCDSCVIIFEGEKELFLHNTRVHHESWSYVDTKKNANWQQKENIGKEPIGPFVCELCTEVHKLWSQLLKHLWIPHLFKCEYCQLSFNRNTKLEDHVNTVHDLVGLIDSTQCGMCGETFGRSSTLARHINSPHNFHCVQCGKSFQSKAVLTKHKQKCAKFQVFAVLEKCLDNISY